MGMLLIGFFGLAVVTIGIALLMTSSDTADLFRRASRGTGVPPGIYTPSAARFAGVLFVVAGVAMIVLAVVVAIVRSDG